MFAPKFGLEGILFNLLRRNILRHKGQLFCENTTTIKWMSPSFINWFNADEQCLISTTPHCFHEDT